MPNVERSRTQRSFGGGEIGDNFLGQVGSELFNSALKKLKNFDILETGALQIRSPCKKLLSSDIGAEHSYISDTDRTNDGSVEDATSLLKAQVTGLRVLPWEYIDSKFFGNLVLAVVKGTYAYDSRIVDTPHNRPSDISRTYNRWFLMIARSKLSPEAAEFSGLADLWGKFELFSFLDVATVSGTSLCYSSSNEFEISDVKDIKLSDRLRLLLLRDSKGVQHPPLYVDLVTKDSLSSRFIAIEPRPLFEGRPFKTGGRVPGLTGRAFTVSGLPLPFIRYARPGEEIQIEPFVPKLAIRVPTGSGPSAAFFRTPATTDRFVGGGNTSAKAIHTPTLRRVEVPGGYFVVCKDVLKPASGGMEEWIVVDRENAVHGAGSTDSFRVAARGNAADIPLQLRRRYGISSERTWWKERLPTQRSPWDVWWEGGEQTYQSVNLAPDTINLNNIFNFSVMGRMPESLIEKINYAPGVGGFLIVRLFKYGAAGEVGAATPPKGYYDIICRVTRFYGPFGQLIENNRGYPSQAVSAGDPLNPSTTRDDFQTVLLSFPTAQPQFLATGVTFDQMLKYFPLSELAYDDDFGAKEGGAEQPTLVESGMGASTYALWNLLAANNFTITQYQLPSFYWGNHPRTVLASLNTGIYTGSEITDTYVISSNISPVKLKAGVSAQVRRIPENAVKALVDGDTSDATIRGFIPGTDGHEDAVYNYLQLLALSELAPGRQSPATPVHADLPLAERDAITWAEKLRSIVFGTKVKELLVRPAPGTPAGLDPSSIDNIQSFRGSTGIVATGDYSICFSSVDGKGINIIYYSDSVDGFRVQTATHQAPPYFEAGVARIVWDHDRKAFWCLSKDGRLALFFLSSEYGLAGWSEYLFSNSVGGTMVAGTSSPTPNYTFVGYSSAVARFPSVGSLTGEVLVEDRGIYTVTKNDNPSGNFQRILVGTSYWASVTGDRTPANTPQMFIIDGARYGVEQVEDSRFFVIKDFAGFVDGQSYQVQVQFQDGGYWIGFIGTGEDRIRDVFRYQEKMCISTKDQIFQFEELDYEGDLRDLGTMVVEGETTFLKHAPSGQQGDSEGSVKDVGSTVVKGRNLANLTAIVPDGDGTEVTLVPEGDEDSGIDTFDASSYISQGRLPLLAMKYRAGQTDTKKAIILNTSSRYVIGEE